MCGDYINGYWIDNWIYWITHSYTQLQCIHSYSFTVHYSTCRVSLQLQLTLTTESQLLLSFFRAQDLLQTQLALTGNQLTWNCNCPRNCPSYITRKQTTKKTPPPIPLLLYDVITGTYHKEKTSTVAWLSIVACLSVTIATVVNTCQIAYSMHVTILKLILAKYGEVYRLLLLWDIFTVTLVFTRWLVIPWLHVYKLDSPGSGQCPVAASYQRINEPSNAIKDEKFLHCMSYY
jgi:hypothetical protein